jgi:sugar phosphate permease
MGITYVGVAVVGWAGTKIAPYLMAKQMPYTQALTTLSYIFLLAWPIALFLLRDRPQEVGQLPDGVEQPAEVKPVKAVEPPRSFAFLLRRPAFWYLLIGSAASIGSIAAVNFHMKFVFEAQGFVEQKARDAIWSTAQGWVLIASIGGRLLAGYLADRLPRKYVMLTTYLVVAVAIPSLFLVTPAQASFVYIFALVFGFAMGADYMLIPLMAADQFGLTTLPRAMSAILPTDTITQFWFPNFVERFRVFLGGDYHTAMMAVFGTAFLGAVAIGLLPRHGVRDEPHATGSPPGD